MKILFSLVFTVIGFFFLFSCASPSPFRRPNGADGSALVRSDYTVDEIQKICDVAIGNFVQRIGALGQSLKKDPKKVLSFENSFGALENASAESSEELSSVDFMSSVSTNEAVRHASEDCSGKSQTAWIEIYSNKDLYNVMKKAQTALVRTSLTVAQQRLVDETMKGFRLSGLDLSDEKLAKFKSLQKEMSDLSIQFDANLNNNIDTAEMNESEMAGIPELVKARFKKLPTGNYKIPAKATFYIDFMENATNADARRKMQFLFTNIEAKANTEILQRTVHLRREAALLLGFKDWADYRIYNKMAKTGRGAWDFLQNLKSKIKLAYQKEAAELLAFKKTLDPDATQVNSWDMAFYRHLLKIKNYSIDDEKIRDYFPSDYVIPQMFQIYSQILGVEFIKVQNAITWHPSVELYEVHDKTSGAIIAHFYTDLYPRDGKYNHAAAFPIRTGREVNGAYQTPITAIVANLNPSTEARPSLLSHDDVETLFHEFGHVMHMSLTLVPFASLAGSNVAGDFVEAPSQMLENWVWQPEILKRITALYSNPAQKMPDDLIAKLIKSRKFSQASGFNAQLLYSIYDLTLHQSPKDIDVTETYNRLYKEMTGLDPLPGSHWPASFGHIMGGYDAGYYGYLWSSVYAFDMFTLFENGNLLSAKVGSKYRKTILEQGNLKEASVLLKEFLGRKPNTDAFFKYLGFEK